MPENSADLWVHPRSMQISPVNLLIAAQQTRNAAPVRPTPVTKAAKEASAAEAADGFAPLAFKTQAAPAAPAAPAPAASPYSANAPLGSQLDIKI